MRIVGGQWASAAQPRRPIRPTALLLVAVSLAALALAGCDNHNPAPDPPATTVNVNVSYRYNAGGGTFCKSQVGYRYQPLSLTGTQGTATTITVDVKEQDGGLPANNTCTVSDGQLGLRPGKWRISVYGAGGTLLNSCDVQLDAGTRSVTFTDQQGGCS
jgi:hypothetical protein